MDNFGNETNKHGQSREEAKAQFVHIPHLLAHFTNLFGNTDLIAKCKTELELMQQELASAKDNNSYRTLEDLNLIDDIHDLLHGDNWYEEVTIHEPSVEIYHSFSSNSIEITEASGEIEVGMGSAQAEAFAIDIVNLINEKITTYEKHKEKDYVAPQVDLEKKNN
jgi:hypothetical protein